MFSAGSAVQWLRDGLHAIDASGDVEALAASVPDTGGVVLVPAFTGPRRAVLGSGRARRDLRAHARHRLGQIARATLDSIASSRSRTSPRRWPATPGAPSTVLRVDGGAAANDVLLQLQADLLGVAVERPVVAETTALGAAYLAGLAVGYWSGLDEIASNWALDRRFEPRMDAAERAARTASLGARPWTASGAGPASPDRATSQIRTRQRRRCRLCSATPNVTARP